MTRYAVYCRSRGCCHSFIHQSSSCSHHSVLESLSPIELMVTMKHQRTSSLSPSVLKQLFTLLFDTSAKLPGFHLGLLSLSTKTKRKRQDSMEVQSNSQNLYLTFFFHKMGNMMNWQVIWYNSPECGKVNSLQLLGSKKCKTLLTSSYSFIKIIVLLQMKMFKLILKKHG